MKRRNAWRRRQWAGDTGNLSDRFSAVDPPTAAAGRDDVAHKIGMAMKVGRGSGGAGGGCVRGCSQRDGGGGCKITIYISIMIAIAAAFFAATATCGSGRRESSDHQSAGAELVEAKGGEHSQ